VIHRHKAHKTDRAAVLPAPEDKATYVRDMFGRIARRYDLLNRVMTLGRDRAWRREAVRRAAVPPGGRALDVACGTGDLALELRQQVAGARVVGVDFTREMLARASTRGQGAGISWVLADAMRLPFADDSFDATVSAFALRNVTSIPAAFAEMLRVVRPGGRVANLEIAQPRLPLFRRLFALYFYRLVPWIGGLVSGQRAAYTYLPHSLSTFLSPPEIAEVMCQAGWADVRFWPRMLGTVALHLGHRLGARQ
jgi:demethylmenaquinone methyltransferase/2-methoxy-6-polyprenyl-1,4-benzoquinol methylase